MVAALLWQLESGGDIWWWKMVNNGDGAMARMASKVMEEQYWWC